MAKYSDLSNAQLADLLGLYGLEPRMSAHIDGGVANTSYQVDCVDESKVVLTVLDNSVDLPVDTLARLLCHLRDNGISTSDPLKSRNAVLVETFEGHQVMVKRFVDGACYAVLPFDLLGAAGAALAKVHMLAAPDWLPAGIRRLTDVSDRLTKFHDQQFAEWIIARIDETNIMFDVAGQHVVVHGDYFADNLIFEPGGNISIIDWETASTDLALLDLGIAIVGMACIGAELDVERMKAFLRGYQGVRHLSEMEAAHLRDAVIFGATVLGYYRYLFHNIRYPDVAKQNVYREMPAFVETVRQRL